MATIQQCLSSFLFDAHRATLERGEELLLGLKPVREYYLAECQAQEQTFKAENGESVNALHFPGTVNKAIIFLQGNGCFYETSVEKPLRWIKGMGEDRPHLLVFNPRGTGKSTGITTPDYVAKDFKLVFDYLVQSCQVDPNYVVLGGHSMGAFFGAEGAAQIQDLFPSNPIHFLSDRSLKDILDRVAKKTDSKLKAFGVQQAIKYYQWNKDPIAALGRLKGRVCILYHPSDEVIPYKESTYYGLKKTQIQYTYLCMEEIEGSAHNRPFTEAENQYIITELRKMLDI
ncbi:MAG: alpha/beta fold hydrolase [Chlamydiia bacterium]|nr:alpha/beta fold hydrolase [Chlamydiia bacterium]